MSAMLRDVPKMVAIVWLEAAPHIGEFNLKNFSYYTLPYFTLPLFFSSHRLQQKRLDRFARTMAQTMRFAVRKCLLGVALIGNYITGPKSPKNPKFRNRDAKFPAK
jgi:hypothetical protein